MKARFIITTISVLALVAFVQGAIPAPAPQVTRSVQDGVFNEDQQKRGFQLFTETCSMCHGHDMSGGEVAPALFGTGFMSNWNGLTVGDLFERIRVSMPPDNPERLTRQQQVDIISAILNANGFPAGKAELDTRTEVMKQIKIEPKK